MSDRPLHGLAVAQVSADGPGVAASLCARHLLNLGASTDADPGEADVVLLEDASSAAPGSGRSGQLVVEFERHELVARRLYGDVFFKKPASAEVKAQVEKLLARGVRAFRRLARFEPYIAGSALTLADCAAFLHLPLVSLTSKLAFGRDCLEDLPQLKPYLAMLGERNDVHVGLLTGNTAGGARLKLAHFDLHERFAFGGYGDAHLDRNAVAVEAHRELRRHSGREFSAEQIWVIGDTPHDVTCARHIGAKVIGVATGQHARDELEAARPDVLLEDLRHVERVMQLVAPTNS